ncbi:two-component system, response regulator YesN [Paenibacillus catalpae]|uniref:Two-component system, response regulator YesN n=1 Tax=Paenibacillus catalpae TaxID=1045775 RepID=A0A1I2BAT9_9BACL|nr:response regulator [Paenibacillus catalpae]SFE53255.1 two-component system, response regulator YesN [Paenibacillus catalpae]
MPIKVLLVDDEPLALENVYELVPWEEYGFEVAARTTSGRTALKLFEQHRPQIVITDISMSPMDGLELGRIIQQLEPATRLIFLTAYRDFDYARQAIEMRAVHYLLKHEISRNRLLEQLLFLRKEIEAETDQRARGQREALKSFLAGSLPKDEISRIDRQEVRIPILDQNTGTFGLLYFEWDTELLLDGSRRGMPWPGVNQRTEVEQVIRSRNDEVVETAIVEVMNGGYTVLLKLSVPNSILLLHRILQKVAASLLDAFMRDNGKAPVIMMASCADKEVLPALQAKLREQYDYTFFLPPRSLCLLEQVPREEERLLAEATDIWTGYATEKISLKKYLKKIIEHCRMGSLHTMIRLAHAEWQKDADPREIVPALGSNAEQIAASLYRIAEGRVKNRMENSQNYSRWVSKAMEYVREHYDDPELSLEKVAGSLQISSIHLRTTFKRETGQSLLDFTTDYRIEMAKKLLRKEELKVYEVSEKVGYKTSQYFSQVFRRVTGMQPKDYALKEGEE